MTDMIGLTKEKQRIENAINDKQHVLIVGETGLGKTQLIKEFATKMGKTLHRVSLNGEIGLNEILGRWLVRDGSTYWQDGILVTAMKEGHWIMFDEINAGLPEVLFCLNSVLDGSNSLLLAEKDNSVIHASDDFRFFATMNPSDSYVGTKDMNQALMSRFHIVLQFKDYTPSLEKKIIKAHVSTLNNEVIEVLIKCADTLRKEKYAGNIMTYCSTRDLINMGRVAVTNSPIEVGEVIELCMLNKMSREERELAKSKLESQNIKFFREPVISGGFEALVLLEKKIDMMQNEVAKLEGLRDSLKSETVAKIAEHVLNGKFDHVMDDQSKNKLKKDYREKVDSLEEIL